MGAIFDRTKEHLGTSDSAIILARRILLRLARELQQGIEPEAPHNPSAYSIKALDTLGDEPDFMRLLDTHRDDMRVPVLA